MSGAVGPREHANIPLVSAAAVGGKYIVEEALGRGGMGVVYRVRDAKTGERFALKRAWARDASKALRRRALLEREFHTLAQLRHPRIIQVYDFGVDDDGPYYTMELLDGADLDKAGQLPWRTACSLICDIASSLAILHSRGLLHRDVSARNVRQTADGHAKLIDFGALSSIGVVGDAVGTPPFIPPEAVQMQVIDARADLFSLGALAYYALTGRHAYPAARASDLRDVWRSRPMAPQRICADIPAALNALVLQLLALDRAARPQTAAEVMERLRVIADLPKEDLPQITRAYLTMPGLVGRDKALLGVRGRMLSLVRGEGGVVLIEGPPGSGRSRTLDACVFEAKLLGAQIVRDAATDDSTEAWGTARRLCSHLFALMPEPAMAASRLGRSVLDHVIEEVSNDESPDSGSASGTVPERSVLLRELRDFLLTLGSQSRLVLVVDDADRIDEASSALLAALAGKSERQSLMIVLTMGPETDRPHAASERLLRSIAHRIELDPLEPEQTLSLMRSVFGDVPNLQLCAGRIHAIAQGSPRASMELAQHLVDRGLARYEAGRWSLPARLDETDLPDSLSDSLALRLNHLGSDARELAEALAIAEGLPVSPANYRQLTAHNDARRVFAALQELVGARVLIATADEPSFTQRGFISVLIENLPEPRSRALHARVAELLATFAGDPVWRAHHLFYAGRELDALELLCGLDLQVRQPPLALLERAVEHAERNPRLLPARALHRLRTAILVQSSRLLAADSFERCLPHVLRQLEHDVGLDIYRELDSVPPDQRLSQALARQQARYLETPEREQVCGVGDAVRELARLTGATCSIAGSVLDLSLVDRLPSLDPFSPLSPVLRVVSEVKLATRDIIQGAHGRAREHYEAVLARIEEPDRAGMDTTQHARTRLGVHYALALIEASFGLDRAEGRAKILEGDRALRVSAWRIRSLLALNQGNVESAQKYARRAELLRLQDEQIAQFIGTDAALELTAYERLGDLFGVKSALDTILVLAQSYRGWRGFVPWAQSSYRLLQGDVQAANEWIAPACAQLRPGRDLAYGGAAIQHVRVLRELGPTPTALATARQYIAHLEEHELSLRLPSLQLEVSLLEAQAGEFERAIERISVAIEGRETLGARGFPLGIFYEARARIGIWMRDREAFERFAAKCAAEYSGGESPHLQIKYSQLMEDARQHGVAFSSLAPVPQVLSMRPLPEDAEAEALRSRMSECVDTGDRGRCALTLLLQSTDSYLGYLYGVEESGIVPLAGLPDTKAEVELEDWLASWVTAERDSSEDGLLTGTASYDEPVAAPGDETHTHDGSDRPAATIYTDREGRRFCATSLAVTRGTTRTLVALLAVQLTGMHLPTPRIKLCAQLASHLLEHHDVIGINLAR
jgi:tetratricopeptide (TPR) repeat protein